jgi:cephalosporin hydroxylase
VSVKPDVDTFQNPWELDQMLAVFERLQPARVLEIGAWHGGTLWHWLQTGETVVVIDDEMRMMDEWRRWADETDSILWLLQGFSQDPEVIDAARNLGPYDWVFVDGDHRYEAVKADWENYRDMVTPGGVFVFHDTQHPENKADYGVGQLWAEITQESDVRWLHIANTGHCGIGIVYL